MPKVLQIRYCKDCNKQLGNHSKTDFCPSCGKKGKRNPFYKHGLWNKDTVKCEDCNKAITYTSKRCKSCRQRGDLNIQYRAFGKLNPNYKDGSTNKTYYCKDCNIRISKFSGYYGEGRCIPCMYLTRDVNGKNNPNWKNGATKLSSRIRGLKLYKYWKEGCLERDKQTCKNCGIKDNLEVHHIVPVSKLLDKYNITDPQQTKLEPEFWMLENGITYCVNCHCLKDKSRRFMARKGGG